MNKQELESSENKKRYQPISVGKLSSQNSVKIPMKICQHAKWIEGDELMFYLDKDSGNVVIVNETLNECPSVETKIFNRNLSQKINDDQQVVIIESASLHTESNPLKLIRNYLKEYSGFVKDNDVDSGKWYLTEDEESSLKDELEKGKSRNSGYYGIIKDFLTEYKRNCSENSLKEAYIFNYHYLESNLNKSEEIKEIKEILKRGCKVILWGYTNPNGQLKSILNDLEILEYYYLKYTPGYPIVEAKKTKDSPDVLV